MVLGRQLRQLRERADLTAEDVAAFLRRTRPTVTNAELGKGIHSYAEVVALLGYYGATDEERKEVLALWEDAKQDTTRLPMPGAVTPPFRSYLRADVDATEERILAALTVPGIFQTLEYASAILCAPSGFQPDETEINRIIDLRMGRQGRLRGAHPLKVHAILDESVVTRPIGGRHVMREQLGKLADLIKQPNITVQVVPYLTGAYGTMSGGFNLLTFAEALGPPAAYLEDTGGGKWVENPDSVTKLATTFDMVAGVALTPDETAALLEHKKKELSSDKQQMAHK
jgi:transcriptional regulator with XRE-family HTH domain